MAKGLFELFPRNSDGIVTLTPTVLAQAGKQHEIAAWMDQPTKLIAVTGQIVFIHIVTATDIQSEIVRSSQIIKVGHGRNVEASL